MTNKNVLGLDVGSVRIGVAFAGDGLSIARRVTTLDNAETMWSELAELIKEYQVQQLVVGLPRGLDGQDTDQTRAVQVFAKEAGRRFGLPIHLQDEALTSVRAREILAQHKEPVDKKAVDATAASLILSDYLEEHKQ